MKKKRILVLVITAPFFVLVGIIGIAVLIPLYLAGLFVGLLEYGFMNDAGLLKDLLTYER